MRRVVAIAVLLVAAPAAAHADDVVTFRVDGAAPASSSAPRNAALDEAFKAATRRALEELSSPEALATQQDVIEREVVKRARLWVASFKVVKQTDRDSTVALEVDVRIDMIKLRDRLVELDVELATQGGTGDPEPGGGSAARKATLLLRVTTVEGAYATYGAQQSDRVPAAADAEVALARRGLALVPAPASGPAAKAGEGLPLGDDGARALAGDARADVVVIAGLEILSPGPVRGVRGVATWARAWVRVLDVAAGGKVIGESQAARGATGEASALVASTAARAALLEAIATALPRRDPEAADAAPVLPLPTAADGEVLVRIRGASGSQVAAVLAYLQGAQGVKKARLRRLAGSEVVLAVRGVRTERLAALIRGAADLGARAKVDGAAVEVTLGQGGS